MSRILLAVACISAFPVASRSDEPSLRVGFAKADITPDVKAKPVYIAGYGNNRKATGVHDPLYVRAIVLTSGEKKIALVSVDVVGLQLPQVDAARAQLKDFTYVVVSSTHNHEGPDVIGLWGPNMTKSGVDSQYLKIVEKKIVETVRAADVNRIPATARFGAARDASLLRDSRLPIIFDDELRVIRFDDSTGQVIGVLVEWNCHPESMESKNTEITADFPYATIAALEKSLNCEVAYFTGTVGGLMTVPENRLKNSAGKPLDGGDWELTKVYGEAVAKLTEKALAQSDAVLLEPMRVAVRRVYPPLTNPGFRALRLAGVLPRPAFKMEADVYKKGEAVQSPKVDGDLSMETEVAIIQLGPVSIACIPGELYPEIVNGGYQEPVDPGADFPDAVLEPTVMKTLPGKYKMLFGLANDECGYIVPKRQWDWNPPFCYGRKERQYGEVNSLGPDTAPVLMKALVDCAADLNR